MTISCYKSNLLITMRKKELKEKIEVTPVILKPILGLNPPVYLTIIYSIVIILIVFFIGFLPGIIKSGKRVTFDSPVSYSSVVVDGSYVGTTPTTVFLPSGEHQVTYSFRDIAQENSTIDVAHPLFLTWLVPRKQEVKSSYYLDDNSFQSYISAFQDEIISYSAVVEYNDVTHYPPLFQSAIETFLSTKHADVSPIETFLMDSSLFITSTEMLDDFTKALSLLQNAGYEVPSLQSVSQKIALLFDNQNHVSEKILPSTGTYKTAQSILKYHEYYIDGIKYEKSSTIIGKQGSLSYPGVETLQKEVTLDSFNLSLREISEFQYAQFIEENPYWAKSNTNMLIEDGLVDESYLQGIYPTTKVLSKTPIRNISYYAAISYTQWLSNKSGKLVRLPSSDELEFAISNSTENYQKSLFNISNDTNPVALLGGVWEITGDEFIPLQRYLDRNVTDKNLIDDIIIKGGSYLNDASHVDKTSIGVLKKNQCSDTTGFRIAWN